MPLHLSSTNARKFLAGLWFFFFVLNIAIIFYLYLDDWIENDNFRASVQQLNSLYVTYVAVIIAFYVTKLSRAGSTNERAGMAFMVALLSSLLWNLMIFIFIFRLVLQRGTIEDSIIQISYFGPIFSWLVAPFIGFYFASSPSQKGIIKSE